MRFVYPWVLSFLLAVPFLAALAYWLLFRAGRRLDAFMSRPLRERLTIHASRRTPVAQIALVSIALFLLVLAAARPQWGRSDTTVLSRGRNLLIALDVSRSMLAADVHPNRLERARVDIMDLIDDLRGDRAGLLVFRGKANMICPLTTDRAFLRQALDGISIDSAPRGETDLADAIRKSLAAFETMPDENNAIILISDGEDLAGRAAAAAAEAGHRGIPIFTVGIGDPAGAEVPAADGRGSMKYHGETVRSRMTESTLAEIAKASDGAYIPLATSSTASTTLGAIYRQHLSRIAAREMEEMLERRLVERYQFFLVPAILLLLVAAALSRGRLASSVRRAISVPCAALSLGVVCVLPVHADTAERTCAERARAAQSLYRQGEYTNAAALYLDAVNGQDDPQMAARCRYNSGLSSFQAGDLSAASETLLPIIALPGFEKGAELYGAANFKAASGAVAATNAAAKAQALERASTGFLHALRAAPDDERARRNLSRAAANIPALRSAAHLESVLAKYGQTPPQQLIGQMLDEQRRVMNDAVAVSTNGNAATLITGFEKLGERQRGNADRWIPLKQLLVDSGAITNEQQRAEVAERIEQTRDAMMRGATLLEDISPDAYGPMAQSEGAVYGFWKMLSEPPALIGEDILVQTNAYVSPDEPRFPGRPDWEDALQLSQLFAERFPKWAEQVIQQRQADTNAPPFTAEDAAKIGELTESLLWIQQDAVKNEKKEERRSAALEALKLLEQIRELLPKNPNNQQQQQDRQQQDQQQDQQQEQDERQQDQQQDRQQQQEQDERQQEQKKERQAGEERKDEPPPDIQEALRRALQREKEHEQEKQRQMRSFPLPPNARDW